MERENKIQATDSLAATLRNAEHRRTADFAVWFAEIVDAFDRALKVPKKPPQRLRRRGFFGETPTAAAE